MTTKKFIGSGEDVVLSEEGPVVPQDEGVGLGLIQDESSGKEGRRYNEWHASRPDARLNAREAAKQIREEQMQC